MLFWCLFWRGDVCAGVVFSIRAGFEFRERNWRFLVMTRFDLRGDFDET